MWEWCLCDFFDFTRWSLGAPAEVEMLESEAIAVDSVNADRNRANKRVFIGNQALQFNLKNGFGVQTTSGPDISSLRS